jgi:hypothetical protein
MNPAITTPLIYRNLLLLFGLAFFLVGYLEWWKKI